MSKISSCRFIYPQAYLDSVKSCGYFDSIESVHFMLATLTGYNEPSKKLTSTE